MSDVERPGLLQAWYARETKLRARVKQLEEQLAKLTTEWNYAVRSANGHVIVYENDGFLGDREQVESFCAHANNRTTSGRFFVVRRTVSEWEVVDDGDDA